jgi:pyruvate,orthophosphate dikinase
MQRKDFAGLFTAMDGFPVVIRTLDPSLHEFLPKRETLMVDLAKLPAADLKAKKEMASRYERLGATVKDLKKVLTSLLERVEELHEFNPMLGHRGCRLGITYPEITEMQARAIFEAAVQVAKKGVKVIAEVMIPLIGSVEEFSNQKKIVVDVAEEVLGKAGMQDLKYLVGTMIEIPRAALTDWLNSGEPSSVQFCYCVDMNYVSCSPYRVPIARLAAAHAAISGDKSEAMRTA